MHLKLLTVWLEKVQHCLAGSAALVHTLLCFLSDSNGAPYRKAGTGIGVRLHWLDGTGIVCHWP